MQVLLCAAKVCCLAPQQIAVVLPDCRDCRDCHTALTMHQPQSARLAICCSAVSCCYRGSLLGKPPYAHTLYCCSNGSVSSYLKSVNLGSQGLLPEHWVGRCAGTSLAAFQGVAYDVLGACIMHGCNAVDCASLQAVHTHMTDGAFTECVGGAMLTRSLL